MCYSSHRKLMQHPCQYLESSGSLFRFSHSVGCVMASHCAFNLNFPYGQWSWAPFHVGHLDKLSYEVFLCFLLKVLSFHLSHLDLQSTWIQFLCVIWGCRWSCILFYGWVTNYHKLSSLKQHPFISSQFWWAQLGPLLKVSWGWHQGTSELSRNSRGKKNHPVSSFRF